jgi:hypothetical protein
MIGRMNSYVIALISFTCIFGGALAGFFFQRFLPSHHLNKESLDSVKLGAGLIATMAALILGLLVSSSKGTYDRVNVLVNEAAANTISLNQVLKNYGPEADPLRQILLDRVTRMGNDIWPEDSNITSKGSKAFKQESSILGLTKMITGLKSETPSALQLKATALAISQELNQERWRITVESTSRIPLPLVAIPVFWITFLIFVYAVFAPRNGTVATVLFFCSVSIAGAIFLICEMSMPLDGSIKIPSQPIRTALEMIRE